MNIESISYFDEHTIQAIREAIKLNVCTRFVSVPIDTKEGFKLLNYDRVNEKIFIEDQDVTYLKDYL